MKRVFTLPHFIGFLIILSFLSINAAKASDSKIPSLEISQFQDSYSFTDLTEIYEDRSNQLLIDDFLENAGSFNFNYPISSQNLDSKYNYWLRTTIEVSRDMGNSPLPLLLYVGKVDLFEVYLLDTNYNLLSLEKGGSLRAAKEKSLSLGNNFRRVAIQLNPGQKYIALIRAARVNQQGIMFDLKLSTLDFFQSWKYVVNTRRDWLFLGFIIAMLIFNLMYFILTKSRGFLYHGIFILGVMIFTMDFFGVTPDLLFVRDHPYLIQFIDLFAVTMLDVGYFLFVKEYLGLSKISEKWNRIFWQIVGLKISLFIIIISYYYISYNEPLVDKSTAISLTLGFIFTISFLAWFRPKTKKQYFLLVGTIFVFIATFLNAYSLIQEKGLLIVFTEIGLSAEILIFSGALAYRRRRLDEEEQVARSMVEIDAFKNKFFTNITHEFRTPLTIINGMADLADEKISSWDAKALREYMAKIQGQSDKMLNLVNQVLDLTKLETHSLKLELHQKDIIELLQVIADEFVILASQKEIELTLTHKEDSLFMDLDEQYLKTVLANLLSNAIKFTDIKGEISINSQVDNRYEKKGLSITVTDSGRGIKEDDLAKIFDRFYQIHSDQHKNIGGTGVGLALSKELIELMGGEINVSSEVDKGSSFNIWLPISRIREKLPLETLAMKEVSSLVEVPFFGEEQKDSPIILCIDDNEDILEYLESILSPHYQVEKARDGKQGLTEAERLIPDTIICDIMMPIMDGHELCNELKTNEKTNHIPVIMLTAKTQDQARLKGWETGADAFLTKPFKRQELFLQIKKLNEQSRKLQEKYSRFSFIENNSQLKKENTFIHSVHQHLENNLTNVNFSVEELAKSLFMSRMQLHRKIKALSNKSASQYIRSFRLHKAKLLLRDMNLSIGDIAYDVGYQDPSYFSKSFNQEFNLSPTEYRESIQ